MKPSANYRNQATASGGWLPPQPAARPEPDFSHWLTRAARGHTWNGDGVSRGKTRNEPSRNRSH